MAYRLHKRSLTRMAWRSILEVQNLSMWTGQYTFAQTIIESYCEVPKGTENTTYRLYVAVESEYFLSIS